MWSKLVIDMQTLTLSKEPWMKSIKSLGVKV